MCVGLASSQSPWKTILVAAYIGNRSCLDDATEYMLQSLLARRRFLMKADESMPVCPIELHTAIEKLRTEAYALQWDHALWRTTFSSGMNQREAYAKMRETVGYSI